MMKPESGLRRAHDGRDGRSRGGGDGTTADSGMDEADGAVPSPAAQADGAVTSPAARTDSVVDTSGTVPNGSARGASLDERVTVGGSRGSRSSTHDGPQRGLPATREREGSREREVTVLHVDDDPLVGDLVTHFLQEAVENVTVVTETDPAAALDRIERAPEDIDCVVSDLEMPGLDGLDLARALETARPDVPVVLFTSKDWQAVAGEPGTEAVTAHVTKVGDHRQFERLAGRVRALVT